MYIPGDLTIGDRTHAKHGKRAIGNLYKTRLRKFDDELRGISDREFLQISPGYLDTYRLDRVPDNIVAMIAPRLRRRLSQGIWPCTLISDISDTRYARGNKGGPMNLPFKRRSEKSSPRFAFTNGDRQRSSEIPAAVYVRKKPRRMG